MSGTSGDGVDASLISSDGKNHFKVLNDKYFKYDDKISDNIHLLKSRINNPDDIKNLYSEIIQLEKQITLFHSKVVLDVLKSTNIKVDLIGFHGQTVFHSPTKKISKQLGDGNLLSQLVQKPVVYDFRQNDIKNGGEGAPLSPIFHQILVKQMQLDLPVCVLNIGGISNVTVIDDMIDSHFISRDLGPGNCLIDEWVRRNKKGNFDKDGQLAEAGVTNDLMLNQALDNFDNRPNKKNLSFDTKDFEINFLRGLTVEDGAATLTDLTGIIIGAGLFSLLSDIKDKLCKVLICGGGRKNKTLIKSIKLRTSKNLVIQSIDDYGIDGDFVESQAFAYLAIRSCLNLPISFPNTTGCKLPSPGGIIVKNF
tara:strand:- start:8374 stop:9471 length:1098 start_codon:yes stop_codon:yes gene_type:complete